MSHTLITVIVTLLSWFLFSNPIYGLLAVGGFWMGREHAQTESRYLKANKTNRASSPWYMGFIPQYWTKDAFINDMTLPFLASLVIYAIYYIY